MKILSVKQENCILSSSKYINLYNQLVIGHYVTPPPLSSHFKSYFINLYNQLFIGHWAPPPHFHFDGLDAPQKFYL